MKLTLKKESLEKILLANWTSVIDIRELLAFVSKYINSKNSESQQRLNKITISRFEPMDGYFLIWIEYESKNRNGTIECHLKLNGEIEPKLLI